ncbi:MAG: bifunctional phosphopantothenoylcysteine decarboxylase/phosphopantothenate--cysteine ligase CoaBC [Vulcanimicrobiaceae bacterium]
MAHVVLGVAGGIAAYKAAALCSALVQRGDDVDVVMSEGAQHFVGAVTFAALTRRPVLASLWEAPESIPHIALARAADVLVIAPATANVSAKLALGIADDLLLNIALATRAPIVVAPAMNSAMYEHPATQGHLETLRSRGVRVVAPERGFLAERETGIGRLAAPESILAAVDAAIDAARAADSSPAPSVAEGSDDVARASSLRGERVLITAGPTREAIDPVRFISNPSTGIMGIELAREAHARGADVELILGPTLVAPPAGVRCTHVVSAQEMYDATLARAGGCTIAIATAAVSDFRPAHAHAHKVKKDAAERTLELERTPDILAALGASRTVKFLVGFAAETHDVERHALEKLRAKRLDAIVANDVSVDGVGFGDGDNDLVLLARDGHRAALGRAAKPVLARHLWDALLRVRGATAAASV